MSLYQEYEPTPDNPCEIKGFRWFYGNDRRERMKVIDLLNKKAKGERFENCKMKFKEIEPEEVSEYVIYDRLYEEDLTLNDEVEIIENEEPDLFEMIEDMKNKPKHIEELEILPDNESYSNKVLYGKINELTKAANYLLDKEEK